jgi:hypothetical protein
MRYLAIFLGIALLFWLPIEDTAENWAILFALAISAWFAVAVLISNRVTFRSLLLNYILIATIAGAFVTPIALLLMAFKTGMHAHGAPEYSAQQLVSVVWKTPIWIAGGFLMGLGGGIWMVNRGATSHSE